jgi:transcriptional regulator with XRE-family HTH domain
MEDRLVTENLWALREQKKLSVAALANRAGLPIGLIIEYESGQRSIDPRHLGRLARALYVEESEIKLQSDRRPTPPPAPREAPREGGREVSRETTHEVMHEGGAMNRPLRPRDKQARPKPPPRPPAPARPSQLAYLEGLLQRLNRTSADLETEIGKPLSQLDKPSASELIKRLQAEAAQVSPVNRHRAYLPEAVDAFEAQYLGAAQSAGSTLEFTLFDGQTVRGQIIGFSPYSITVRQANGSEITLNKLALVSYTKEPAA